MNWILEDSVIIGILDMAYRAKHVKRRITNAFLTKGHESQRCAMVLAMRRLYLDSSPGLSR
jgi:hypothetical protein